MTEAADRVARTGHLCPKLGLRLRFPPFLFQYLQRCLLAANQHCLKQHIPLQVHRRLSREASANDAGGDCVRRDVTNEATHQTSGKNNGIQRHSVRRDHDPDAGRADMEEPPPRRRKGGHNDVLRIRPRSEISAA